MIHKIGSILIPKIGEKIEKKLKILNLKPEISPKKFLKFQKTKKHRYFSPCLKEWKKFAFYARLHNNLDAKEKFIREIDFLKKMKRTNLKIKKLIPQIEDYGIEKDFEWFLREYSAAPPLGYSRSLTQKSLPEITKEIVEAIFRINKINPKFLKNLKKFDPENYYPVKHFQDLVKRKIVQKSLALKILKFIKENFTLLERENKYFCHGDLNLGNILSDGKKILIIDWELIQLNNFAYDIGYLWTHLWEAKRSFRKKLIESYISHLPGPKFPKFKKILPILVSYFSLGGIEYKKIREKITILEKRRKFYLNLLKNCLDFNKLIKL